jgi:mRNA interferase MazF
MRTPVFSVGEGLSTQVQVGTGEGVLHTGWITCDQLVSIPKSEITDYVGSLAGPKLPALNRALRVALDLP